MQVSTQTPLRGTTDAYEWENGRRYHGYRRGTYMYPNDEKECEKIDIYHKIFLVLRKDELHRAPITPNYEPTRILDLGTGTGIWAIEMADKYPQAEIIGTDLSLIQPKWQEPPTETSHKEVSNMERHRIPKNLRFQISDFESEWALGRDSFDLIHLRHAIGSVSSYPALFRKIFDHLKPYYGWFEYVDIDMTPRADDNTLERAPALVQWHQYINEATAEVGKPLGYERRIREYLTDAGFVNIQEVTYRLPIGAWPSDKYGKQTGRWYDLGFSEGIEGLTLGPLCRVKKWPFENVKAFMKDVLQQARSRDVHAYHTAHVWIAQRPPVDNLPPPNVNHGQHLPPPPQYPVNHRPY